MVLKRIALSLALAILLLAACKHEIPGGAGSGGNGGSGGGGGNPPPAGSTCSPDSVYFQQQVLPIFLSNCAMSGCHDNISRQDGVILTSYTSIMNTGDIEAGNPSGSKAYRKIIDNDPGDRMPPPPRPALPADQREIIRKWILQGAQNNSCVSATCDTANVTYSAQIRSLVSAKCQGCHNTAAASGGVDLSTYNGVKAKVNDGRLWGAINHQSGFSPMPKNGNKLSDCELAQFRKWIAAGAPNN